MGQPVVHFEIMGRDADQLRDYYAEMFDWEIETDNALNYGTIERAKNLAPDGSGISGGVGQMPPDHDGHLTFYVAVDDVEAALTKAESLGGTRIFGPEEIDGMLIMGHFTDPEDNMVGVMTPLPRGG